MAPVTESRERSTRYGRQLNRCWRTPYSGLATQQMKVLTAGTIRHGVKEMWMNVEKVKFGAVLATGGGNCRYFGRTITVHETTSGNGGGDNQKGNEGELS